MDCHTKVENPCTKQCNPIEHPCNTYHLSANYSVGFLLRLSDRGCLCSVVLSEAVVCGEVVLECKPCNSKHVSFVDVQHGT